MHISFYCLAILLYITYFEQTSKSKIFVHRRKINRKIKRKKKENSFAPNQS